MNEEKEISLNEQQIKTAINNLLTHTQDNNKSRITRYKLKGNYKNVVIVASQISEVSGGSCWSEDYHNESETPFKEIGQDLKTKLIKVLTPFFEEIKLSPNNLESYLDEFLEKTKKYDLLGEWTDYEYYGNSTTYGAYGLNLDTLLSQTCSDEINRIYHKELKSFKEFSISEALPNKMKF